MTWVYKRTEPTLWTVGFYKPDGTWEPESDHGSDHEAAERVHWLNGDCTQDASTSTSETNEDRVVKRLLVLTEDELDLCADDLFDLVHDAADKAASDTNNQGLVDQIQFLVDQLGEKDTEQALRNLATE